MSTRLRMLARNESNPIVFIATHQRIWTHASGTGVRELARVWVRAQFREVVPVPIKK